MSSVHCLKPLFEYKETAKNMNVIHHCTELSTDGQQSGILCNNFWLVACGWATYIFDSMFIMFCFRLT